MINIRIIIKERQSGEIQVDWLADVADKVTMIERQEASRLREIVTSVPVKGAAKC